MVRKILLTVSFLCICMSIILPVCAAVPCHNVSCDGILLSSTEQRVIYSSEFDCSVHSFCKKQYEYLTLWEVVRCNRCGALDKEEQMQIISIKENHRSLK